MNDTEAIKVLKEIRNWIRAGSHKQVKELLESSLPDAKDRMAYQMSDGKTAVEAIRKACKMSPNGVVALHNKCVSLGLMEEADQKKRRLFDLNDFGLLPE